MNAERAMDRAAGGPWREVAMHRGDWDKRGVTWIEQQDLPWASFEQLALDV